MQLVLDTNILLSALIRNSKTRTILLHPSFSFFLPEYSLEEFEKYKGMVLEKSNLSVEELDLLLGLLLERVTVVSASTFASFMPEAWSIMALIDPDDSPFIALALSFHNDGIWSQDKDFERQSKVKVWKTSDLVELIYQSKLL
ncbi:MAG: PIN domain-containing protein [Bacteroidetes bacterium]|nr:MAG: PIN domain-containing protein [Bacteroidota bacterium]